ncbi:recombinase family protein [Kineosporia sp. A_224]|uniref:recombinase family protein n=1 Tax=Kineosporia sp. A_224 TaxID=1962180 RepID=UPI000B4A9F2E|nr:recombinase family protein [Kineosporia sp. A_224]
MAVIGYARVSTGDQDTALQVDALKLAGCERVFEDHASGTRVDRPQLTACLDYLRQGDTLVVWKLDRLGRSLQHLLAIADDLGQRGVSLVITTMGVDTRTPGGQLLYSVLGAVAQYERTLIVERTRAGLDAARARGKRGGRKPALKPRQAQLARQMYAETGPDGRRAHTVAEIAAELKIGRSTVYRYLTVDQVITT